MAAIITLNDFKLGDTPTFRFSFTNPYVGFDWSVITLDGAMTSVLSPVDNTGAAATRIARPLVSTPTGAYYEFTLTPGESNALSAGTTYTVEVQLKQGGISVVTPVTAKVKVLQDYVK